MKLEIVFLITGIVSISYGILGRKLNVDFRGIKIQLAGELDRWQRLTLFAAGSAFVAASLLLTRDTEPAQEGLAEGGGGTVVAPTILPTATTEPEATETIVEAAPSVYDGFDDPTYDGSVNTALWNLSDPDCGLSQQDGHMLLANGCVLEVSRPGRVRGRQLESLVVQLRQPSDYEIPEGKGASTTVKVIVDFDNGWWDAECGVLADADWIGVRFLVYDTRLGTEHEQNNLYIADHPIDYDRWYQVQLQVDPETMSFECLLDGAVIGSFIPENGDELRNAFFKRWLDAGGDAKAATLVDFFRLIPPHAQQEN